MSHYLIDRIAALPNVELHMGSEIVGLHGDRDRGLTGATFRDSRTGETGSVRRAIFSCSLAPTPIPLARRMCGARWKGFRPHGGARRGLASGCRSKPVAQASLPSETYGPARPSASPPRSVKARPSSRRSILSWCEMWEARRPWRLRLSQFRQVRNGLLIVELTKEIPEELKPRRIAISGAANTIAGESSANVGRHEKATQKPEGSLAHEVPYSAAIALRGASSSIVSPWLSSFVGLIRNHTAYRAGRKSRIITVPAAVPPINV